MKVWIIWEYKYIFILFDSITYTEKITPCNATGTCSALSTSTGSQRHLASSAGTETLTTSGYHQHGNELAVSQPQTTGTYSWGGSSSSDDHGFKTEDEPDSITLHICYGFAIFSSKSGPVPLGSLHSKCVLYRIYYNTKDLYHHFTPYEYCKQFLLLIRNYNVSFSNNKTDIVSLRHSFLNNKK